MHVLSFCFYLILLESGQTTVQYCEKQYEPDYSHMCSGSSAPLTEGHPALPVNSSRLGAKIKVGAASVTVAACANTQVTLGSLHPLDVF